MDPIWAKCLKSGQNFSRSGQKKIIHLHLKIRGKHTVDCSSCQAALLRSNSWGYWPGRLSNSLRSACSERTLAEVRPLHHQIRISLDSALLKRPLLKQFWRTRSSEVQCGFINQIGSHLNSWGNPAAKAPDGVSKRAVQNSNAVIMCNKSFLLSQTLSEGLRLRCLLP